MKSAISGYHGFIAKHLIKKLEQLGHELVLIDRAFLYSLDAITKLLIKEKPDYVFHLSGYGNMSDQIDKKEIFQANVINTFNLLMASQEVNYKAFINFSTSSVLLEYETMYSATKLIGELLASQFFKTVSVRPSTVIGTGEQSVHLIPTLIRSCIFGEEMPLETDSTHDFIAVEDVVSGVLKIIENMNKVGKQVNISTGLQTTNQQVREIVERLTGKKVNVKYVDKMREYDTKDWKVDNSKLLSLGWQPVFTLEETITKMIKAQVWN